MVESCDVLKALGNGMRIDIVRYLDARGEASVGDIMEFCDSSQSVVSQHLAVLRANGIVKRRIDKQMRFYSLANELPMKIINVLDVFADMQSKKQ